MPVETGEYYVIAYVEETDQYSGLESEAFSFAIIEADGEQDNSLMTTIGYESQPWDNSKGICVTTLFGTPTVYYKAQDKIGADWTTSVPIEIGTYDYRIIVPGVEGQYNALNLSTVNGDTGFDYIEEGGFSICKSSDNIAEFYCESVVEGKTPSPEYKVNEGTPKIKFFTSEAFDSLGSLYDYYNEDDNSWNVDEGLALKTPPTTPGEYYAVIFVPRTTHYNATTTYCWFEIITKEEADEQTLDDLIDEIRDLKIPSKLTLKDKEAVYKAKAMYETLSDAAKAKLSQKQLAKLNAAIEKVDELQKAVDEEQRIAAAKATYNKQVAAAKATVRQRPEGQGEEGQEGERDLDSEQEDFRLRDPVQPEEELQEGRQDREDQ